jgi:hypothetical protein
LSALLHRTRVFWPAVIGLLAIMGAVQVRSAGLECQTFDEAVHLAAGYSYLRTGDFRLGMDHPPLGKMLNALPLMLWLKPSLPLADPSWVSGDHWQFGKQFLYRNEASADTILSYARAVTIGLTVALGLFLATWARRHFGAETALLATFLFSLDPNIIAHGRYVTTDLIAAASIFVATMAIARFIVSGRAWDGLLAGVGMGLAIASKFSALLLIPLYVLLYLIRWWQTGGHARSGHVYGQVALLVAMLVSIGAVYWSETLRMLRGTLAPLVVAVNPSSPGGRLFRAAGGLFHLPAHTFFLGLLRLADHNSAGDPSYVLGHTFPTGVWYYFPVVFAVKTPTAILLLVLLIVWGALAQLSRQPFRVSLERIRQARFHWFVLTVPVILYFAVSMESKINLGVRHLLPIYPFLFVLTAAALFRIRAGRLAALFPVLLLTAIAVQAAESYYIYPHYLAFFNTPSGGPVHGPNYLLDSNIDWGQGLEKLKAYLDKLHNPPLCMAYFGQAIPEYYGITSVRLPVSADLAGRNSMDCVAAVSATLLYGLYSPPGAYEWLRGMQPAERIGYSIYIYDLRRKSPRSTPPGM